MGARILGFLVSHPCSSNKGQMLSDASLPGKAQSFSLVAFCIENEPDIESLFRPF